MTDEHTHLVQRAEVEEVDLADTPLHFELCAWQADPNWHHGTMPAIVLASTDEEPYGKGHGYWAEQMIRSPEDLGRYIAYLRLLGEKTFGRSENV